MSFLIALQLVKLLEGGKHKGDDRDSNDTNCGIIQSTWEGLGFRGSVLNASDADIANAYNVLWRTGGANVYDIETKANRSIFELTPEPVDAFAFQFYINVPPAAFRMAFQAALGVKVDGSFGPITLKALGLMNKTTLLESLRDVQTEHYVDNASETNLHGLLDRVDSAFKYCYTML